MIARHSLVACLLALALCALAACDQQPERPRKQQLVKLLPDTPPPPPPPPKPEDKPPPKAEDKPQQQDLPKPDEAPQPQALKTDEAAGDGPGGGLAAGTVTQDYTDQKIGQGTVLGGGGGDGVEAATARLAAIAYARAVTQALNEHLTQDREVKRLDYRVQVELWLSPAGGLQRAELVGSTGDARADGALRAALAGYAGLGRPIPARMPQPLRLLVSNRLVG